MLVYQLIPRYHVDQNIGFIIIESHFRKLSVFSVNDLMLSFFFIADKALFPKENVCKNSSVDDLLRSFFNGFLFPPFLRGFIRQ